MQINIYDLNSLHYQNLLLDFAYDIYHHPHYILAEAHREKAKAEVIFISEGSKRFLLPYLLRECPEGLCAAGLDKILYDAASPYGYPGILLNYEAQNDPSFLQNSLDLLTKTFQSRNICSAFFRLHPILNADMPKSLGDSTVSPGGMTVSLNLKLSEQEQWGQIQSSRRNRVNQCRKRGLFSVISSFSKEYIPIFMDIYGETMDRLSAIPSYYFSQEYYESLVDLSPHVFICLIKKENEVLCGGIFTECGGIVQYHLSGTKTNFLQLSPNGLMIDEVRRWGKARGNKILHLGGGLGSQQDSLFEFKASFSKQRHCFSTLRLITHSENYQRLVEAQAKQLNIHPGQLLNNPFFPAYRALEAS